MGVIRKLKAHFARHGIPEQLVTDNGSQFTSRDFLKFSRDWDFEHLTSSPHHSQGNGKAEAPAEVYVPVCPQYNELPTTVPRK